MLLSELTPLIREGDRWNCPECGISILRPNDPHESEGPPLHACAAREGTGPIPTALPTPRDGLPRCGGHARSLSDESAIRARLFELSRKPWLPAETIRARHAACASCEHGGEPLDHACKLAECERLFLAERKLLEGRCPENLWIDRVTLIVVAGCGRSGTSCVAGMLHNLGVSMGRTFIPENDNNPSGFFEEAALQQFARETFADFSTAVPTNDKQDRTDWLAEWGRDRFDEGRVIGLKQPSFCCLCLTELASLWPRLRVIVPARPMPDCEESLRRTGYAGQESLLETYAARRDDALARLGVPVLTIDYHDVLRDPVAAARQLARFSHVVPTPEQYAAAVAHVQPELCHVNPPAQGSKVTSPRIEPIRTTQPVDVFYPLSNGSKWANNELRYSLRSLEKYGRNLGRVFVVGEKPPWLTGVVHIPMADCRKLPKDANMINKCRAAIRAGISRKFVRASDDQFLLAPTDLAAVPVTHGGGDTSGDKGKYQKWWNRVQNTYDYLKSKGYPAVFYETHLFQPHDAELFEAAVADAPYEEKPGLVLNTLTLNQYPDVKSQSCGTVRGKLMQGYSDGALVDPEGLKKTLAEKFPEPSRFEIRYDPAGSGVATTQDASTMRLWSFWEGPQPPYVALCQETLLKHNPTATILSRQDFTALTEEHGDADVDCSHLCMAHKADWIRIYLLKHLGGVWIDADAVVLRPLDRFLAALRCCWAMTYYQTGVIGGGFMGTPPNSIYINEMYDRAKFMIQSKDKLSWRALLGKNMELVLSNHGWQGFLKLDWTQIIPVEPHKKHGKLCARATEEEHAALFNDEAYIYMLSHNIFPKALRNLSRDAILSSDYFLGYVFRRALHGEF